MVDRSRSGRLQAVRRRAEVRSSELLRCISAAHPLLLVDRQVGPREVRLSLFEQLDCVADSVPFAMLVALVAAVR